MFLHMNLSYELIKHVKRNSHIEGQIYLWCVYLNVDYRVGIFPFSVDKCDVTDTLLPHGAVEVRFQSAQPRT